ncbi:hypothetical protein GCM10023149_47060 [Mucilaginibacter gynuensis]|uniref:BlaR1 peptidase M56 n=1 Tax=Mucilaginibacter gynuensis TaxID=1302236 RepID=A0ABP8HDA2_9SPHI
MSFRVIVVPFLNVEAMALFPFILVKNKEMAADKTLINHELIHLKQEAELLVIPFYILYLLNYIANLFIYRNHNKAYLNIVFEREAYRNEKNYVYLKQRGLWFWRFCF